MNAKKLHVLLLLIGLALFQSCGSDSNSAGDDVVNTNSSNNWRVGGNNVDAAETYGEFVSRVRSGDFASIGGLSYVKYLFCEYDVETGFVFRFDWSNGDYQACQSYGSFTAEDDFFVERTYGGQINGNKLGSNESQILAALTTIVENGSPVASTWAGRSIYYNGRVYYIDLNVPLFANPVSDFKSDSWGIIDDGRGYQMSGLIQAQ